jgi:UDP-N-acetylmuramoylalanine--D-glutamate ligase
MQKTLTLVVGLGKTGFSIARHLFKQGDAFMVFDTRDAPDAAAQFKAEFPNIPLYLGRYPHDLLSRVHTILTSPGVSESIPLFQEAHALGIPILGDIECFARVVSVPVIAITGTNGKSTVTTLVGEMAKADGRRVAVAGNIGTPVLELLDNDENYDLWVLELSSFQLDLTESLLPWAATVLNVSPDHLDRHGSMAAYWEAKQRVYFNAKHCLFNRDDQQTCPDPSFLSAEQKVGSYGLNPPTRDVDWGLRQDSNGNDYIACGQQLISPISDLKIKGRHNWLNAIAACALADTVGISITAMTEVLSSFSGLSHRCQWVRDLAGVTWIDDSKGTNIGATISAILGIGGAMQGKIVLIAGGQGKGADFTLLREVAEAHLRSMVLIGQDADKLAAAMPNIHQENASSLEEAVRIAKNHAQPGDVVLLSPACASLDMFRDYNHRGEVFSKAVEAL